MATPDVPNGNGSRDTNQNTDHEGIIETPFLIVGAGPAGASLACFLASHNLTGIMLSAASGTAKEPRAHITNAAALECLRAIGLEAEAVQHATPPESMQHTRWCRSMAGEEFARIHSWGNQPERKGEYEAASPCRHVDLPQTLLEPILVQESLRRGWSVRFETQFRKYERAGDGSYLSTLQDLLTGQTYRIRSKYLFGCDGARSQIMKQLDLPLIREPGQGMCINLLVDADLSKHMKYRNGNLHWIFTPEIEHPPWGWSTILRMVKPWHEWMFIIFPEPGFDDFRVRPTQEEYLARVREWIGDDEIPVKVLDVAKWYVNEIVAERYSEGNIFCLGDAVHRHPPLNGLGSNTCVQDAWNLAWKVAYVERGLADTSLLETFSAERQPIGAGVIKRANQGLRDHVPVWDALGALPGDVEERRRQHAELSAPTEAGRARRKRLTEAVAYTAHEFGGIGIEMNQRYDSGAIHFADEKEARRPPPPDDVLQYQISTYPGSRVPHAWLNKRSPVERISTIDLVAHGAFCLLTGVGGDAWKRAAFEATRYIGVPIKAYSIGWRQDWEDVYGDWERRREIEEDGCVLLRPDRTVCWRSMTMRDSCNADLLRVLKTVLGRAKVS
ncbi:related to phenol 2-monooxygenase [Lecanosticta acicola]|uniref:Related to phenol 2-monooxygenase n=1 Tax=Lecanosticta acicola TaxID=111012 RepID=A0AAI8YY32_9PEZI|nr:related to phenol 2-monooxygenase [Lecanosticta acicola]